MVVSGLPASAARRPGLRKDGGPCRDWRRMKALLACCLVLSNPAIALSCDGRQAHSGATAPIWVELYTSQGCSSCPPAERWLAALPSDTLAFAFHLDYWDYLGWRDRFARPEFAQRQREQRAVNGARGLYTPQVVVDGRDRLDWLRWQPGAAQAARLRIALRASAGQVQARIEALPGEPLPKLAGSWLVTQRGLVTEVAAGENGGRRLQHEHVVRQEQRLAPFEAREGQSLSFRPEAEGDVSLLLTDAQSGRPIQGLRLRCSA